MSSILELAQQAATQARQSKAASEAARKNRLDFMLERQRAQTEKFLRQEIPAEHWDALGLEIGPTWASFKIGGQTYQINAKFKNDGLSDVERWELLLVGWTTREMVSRSALWTKLLLFIDRTHKAD